MSISIIKILPYRINSITIVTLFSLLATSAINAATVTFSDFQHHGSDAVDYIIVIEDDAEAGVSAGTFKISYQVDPLSVLTTAKLTGIFFDAEDSFEMSDGPYTAANLGLSNESVSSCGQGFNTNKVMASGGCNSNLNLGGGASTFQGHQWDVGIAWKNNNDLSGGQIESFEISSLDLSIEDISAIGIRGQDTNGMGGSAKDFSPTPSAVPIPASAWLLGSALIGLAGIKRKQ